MRRPSTSFRSIYSALERSDREYERRIRQLKKDEERRTKEYNKQLIQERKEDSINYARQLTDEANSERANLLSILKNITTSQNEIALDNYIINDEFSAPPPEKPLYVESPKPPSLKNLNINLGYISKFINWWFKRVHQKQFSMWQKLNSSICEQNDDIKREYNQRLEDWRISKGDFEEIKLNNNNNIKAKSISLYKKEKEGIEFYFNLVLESINYGSDYFNCDWDINYIDNTMMLVIDYSLPLLENIPNLKQAKYVATRSEIIETFLTVKELANIYDEVLYQLCLRVIYEVYHADNIDCLKSVVFNGWITQINKANGIEGTSCILSLQSSKDEFMALNLSDVDARLCFRSLKGISGTKLFDCIPVAPIIKTNTSDRRFVESYNVADKIEGYNLAAMNWEDFEHLIRELFEKEFAPRGGQIKVTRSSRDGGVDVVVFDPDPIRGGKFVIQAKRYTNVVGVSAVRDLYGTVMNEGASRGILVTTSHYGADSYEFAKDKPLTLLNGDNLLHLLKTHGYTARIDLKEAKKIIQKVSTK